MNPEFNIYTLSGLKKIDLAFLNFISGIDNASYLYLLEIRKNHSLYEAEKTILLSKYLERFLSEIFPIKNHLTTYIAQAKDFKKIYELKRTFVQKRALRKYNKEEARDFDIDQLSRDLGKNLSQTDKRFSMMLLTTEVLKWLKNENQYEKELDIAARYCAFKAYFDQDSVVFQLPQKTDYNNLVDFSCSKTKHITAWNEANYCIYCHNQDKDSCRNGMESQKFNPLGNQLSGCPLEQKISEMNYLYSNGNIIAALAVAMIDNPLIAATGDRICNDCIKSCIYQKQDPVNIPLVETQLLKDILNLPYGAEIYYLLSRWNPLLNQDCIFGETLQGKILVVGLGPAGFAMAYYLLRLGHEVVAIDSLKINPLPQEFFSPIKNWKEIISTYKPQGFGGVSEYGITDRWDKNNLLLIRMILERFNNFELMCETKLGKNINFKTAVEQYDYIALCLGAGRPHIPDIKNIDAKGVMSAFEFLMKANLGLKLDIKMPSVILGCGLTAIDCAVEALKHSHAPGDVTILYRKSIQESPSYKLNHEELQIAIDLGVNFILNTDLEKISVDENGEINMVNDIPAKSLIFAIGTHYNDRPMKEEMNIIEQHKEKIGIFGDLNPEYEGSVVKAIASSKNSYKKISQYVSNNNHSLK